MHLSKQLWSIVWIWLLGLTCIDQCYGDFLKSRLKRQNSAEQYIPEYSITPGGENDSGGWSEWSSPSECSRSCGGGVAYQTRECLQTSESQCEGGNTRYFSCNTEDCPEDELDFRSQQCARFNGKQLGGSIYDWIPYKKGSNPCQLNCSPVGGRSYYNLESKVVDGTRCNDHDLDICVDGKCHPVGCDKMLGSSAKYDKCKKCNGDGSTCITIADTFKSNKLVQGYNDILMIPSGATNIKIEESKVSNNYLACRNASSHYYLNGNWRIDYPNLMFFGGCHWTYERNPNGFAAVDHLSCSGPTNEALYIVMLMQDKSVSLEYEFSIPTIINKNTPDEYTWTDTEFSPCSADCDGGTQSRSVTCINSLNSEEVDERLCDKRKKPDESQKCGEEPCGPHWVESEWGKCSKGCGADGIQNRSVTCERNNSNGKKEDDSVCVQFVGEKPATEQECNRDVKTCPKYHLGPWTPCDKLCGEGKQKRNVTCYIEENGKKKVLADSECVEDKPIIEKMCMLNPCEGVDWIISEWSGCDKCGQNVETRTAICGSKSNTIYPDEFCAPEVPLLTRPCKSKKCDAQWFTSEWSECSAACGKGVQSRIVICGVFEGLTVTPAADDTKCNASRKPTQEQECEGEEKECPGQWFAGPWSHCSKECGGGERSREVFCLSNKTKSLNCDSAKLEPILEKCNTHACTEDKVSPENIMSTTISGEVFDEDECEEDDLDEESISKEKRMDDLMLSDEPTENQPLSETIEPSIKSISSTTLSGSSELTTEESSSTVTETTSEATTDDSTIDLSSTSLSSTSELTTDDSSSTITETTSEATTDDSTVDLSSTTLSSTSEVTTDVSSSTVTGTTSDDSTIDSSSTTLASTSDMSTESSTSVVTGTTSEDTSTSTTIVPSSTTFSSTSELTTDDSSSTITETTSEATTDDSTVDLSSTTLSSTSEVTTDVSSSTVTETTSDDSTIDSSSTTLASTSDMSTESSTSEVTELTSEATSDSSTIDTSSTILSSTSDISTESSTSEATTDSSTIDTSSTILSSTSDISTESSTSEATTDSSTIDTSSTILSSTSDISTESSTSDVTELTSEATTDSSTSFTESSTEELTTEQSTSYTLEAVTQINKHRKCKVQKKSKCKGTEFGCCPDKKTIAIGPFDEGCPIPKTCSETKFGCCPDGVSIAKGKNNKGCPPSQCAETFFGCCPDMYTPAEGDKNEGCPILTTLPPITTIQEEWDSTTYETTESSSDVPETTEEIQKSCSFSEFGCCVDGITEAKGNDFKGCADEPKNCEQKEHGCCRDGVTPATGPDNEGCPSCTNEPFGCCSDNQTPAHGPHGEGCCLNSSYGCCPDNINSAIGPNDEGCNCENSTFGCCPDKKTSAHGPNNLGCGCETSQFGCCTDKLTSALGPKFEGCPCHTTQFGCCPDGLTLAKGPNQLGCDCSQTEFKCCKDKKTPAKGPNEEGCTCVETEFGCCPDGETAAQGAKFEGCTNVEIPKQISCGLPNAPGNCTNFTIKYFYDKNYGSCNKFWYGGCEGNDNRFDSNKECISTCQEFMGKERCLLPQSSGPCSGSYKKWYFNTDIGRCEEFIYGGCFGSTNRFDSLEECQSTCDQDNSIPPCEQTEDAGPCHGSFERWYYDNATDACRPFTYGGCKGNKNNHPTEHACSYNCRQPGVFKEQCRLPKQTGNCSEQHPRWYYDESEKKCEPFYYTGCDGNKNNFQSLESCEEHCPKEVAKDICELPAVVGQCFEYNIMWYFDTQNERCQQFYYGGCGGNENKFVSEDACLARCDRKLEPTTTRSVTPDSSSSDVCTQNASQGDCDDYQPQYYYNSTYDACLQFYYGGCGGNGNRFAKESDCLERCKKPENSSSETETPPQNPVSQNVCESDPDPGNCDDYTLKWYFNANEKRCVQFYYGGCGGNDNQFKTEEECQQQCSSAPAQIDSRFREPESSAENICFLPAKQGDCEDNQSRWYYNSAEGLCDEFSYTGCNGNANNYATEEECEEKCLAVQDTCNLPPVQGRCNETLARWYYDDRVKNCFEFEFTGCRGNRNNFMSQEECQQECSVRQESPQPETPYSVCDLHVDEGECDNRTTAWFFDRETSTCTAFTFNGCGGNGNRFVSKEQCDRQCGVYKEVDVCREPVLTGPCRQWQTRFFYNGLTKTCEAFTYGGCDGTGNRFEDKSECESVCIEAQEPNTLFSRDMCKLPAEGGKCNTNENLQERRWYFDVKRGACLVFNYSGCSGNQNNFRSYQSCTDFCNPEYNETSNEVSTNKCEYQEEACTQLRCPYGKKRVVDNESSNECFKCECENPCENHQCSEEQQCAVIPSTLAPRQYVAICRETNKPGECPIEIADNRDCARECYTDADCGNEDKCCSSSCGYLCVRPVENVVHTTQPATRVLYPGEMKATLQPKEKKELDVKTSWGNVAVLRCFATGSPPPNITWSHNNLLIDTTQGHFWLTSSGDLTIVQVNHNNSGSYVCVATNGLGDPVRRVIELEVTAPVKIPAYIYGDRNVTQIVVLNMPAIIRCPAGGNPAPHVTWWRHRGKMGMLSPGHEIMSDFSLSLRSVQLSDLGVYTCQAYNGVGKPFSLTVVLMAYGPARAVNNQDKPFLQYIIDPAIAPITKRPLSPYRPTRPPVVPPPYTNFEIPQRRRSENAVARIELDPASSIRIGNSITFICKVGGYPAPNVTWTKNGYPLYSDERVYISTNPHKLTISDLRSDDVGVYGCTARNNFSFSTSENELKLQTAFSVPPDCLDSPFYANCKRIVQGHYCNNQYYARFCCRSCALAGQLNIQLLYGNAV